MLENALGDALGELYVAKHFAGEAKVCRGQGQGVGSSRQADVAGKCLSNFV